MDNLDFTIEQNDLKCLFIACKLPLTFENFIKDCKKSYSDYYTRNSTDSKKYGTPKTFSQWINGQTIALT